MRNTLPQLAVHKGLRGDILLELKRSQPRTATELGAKLGVSANAIRHHLKELVTESLITYGRERHVPARGAQLCDPGGGGAVPGGMRRGAAVLAGRPRGRGRAAHPYRGRL